MNQIKERDKGEKGKERERDRERQREREREKEKKRRYQNWIIICRNCLKSVDIIFTF